MNDIERLVKKYSLFGYASTLAQRLKAEQSGRPGELSDTVKNTIAEQLRREIDGVDWSDSNGVGGPGQSSWSDPR